ncbi:hypothetical protein [Patulibacter defluvii]|uniref:hypothetical protein n=1 Tax=Patulibacter defluvii TaxID=3095358 RepID=UPI002A750064|nr:hypothetical protein [Patulibacter sp. DM4]
MPLRALLLAGLLLALLPATAAATEWGIADQKPQTFANPHWPALQAAGMVHARYVVSYDALRYARTPGLEHHAQRLDAWLLAARAAGVRPLISFQRSASPSRSLRTSVARTRTRFVGELRRFRAAYPWVRDFSIWNEPNHSGPYQRRPRDLGRLYRRAADELRRDCRGCRLVAGDLQGRPSVATYARQIERGAGRPIRLWGLNNYFDVNRFNVRDTAAMLRAVRGTLWLTETGGVYSRLPGSEARTPFAAQRAGARSDEARLGFQNRATRQLGAIVRRYRSRIGRVYVYQLQGAPDPAWIPGAAETTWDSGLLDPRGVPRWSYGYLLRSLLPGPAPSTPTRRATVAQSAGPSSAGRSPAAARRRPTSVEQ